MPKAKLKDDKIFHWIRSSTIYSTLNIKLHRKMFVHVSYYNSIQPNFSKLQNYSFIITMYSMISFEISNFATKRTNTMPIISHKAYEERF